MASHLFQSKERALVPAAPGIRDGVTNTGSLVFCGTAKRSTSGTNGIWARIHRNAFESSSHSVDNGTPLERRSALTLNVPLMCRDVRYHPLASTSLVVHRTILFNGMDLAEPPLEMQFTTVMLSDWIRIDDPLGAEVDLRAIITARNSSKFMWRVFQNRDQVPRPSCPREL